MPDQLRSAAKVVCRPIAAGEVVLDSVDSSLAQMIKQTYGDAAAIEMEGAGVALAGQLNESLPTIIVRGISDYADGHKENTDRDGWQQRAARNAAAFAVTLLAELPPVRRTVNVPVPARHVLVSGSVPTTAGRTGVPGWSAGEQLRIGDRGYLLVDGTLAERPLAGAAARYREARGLQVTPVPQPGAEHVWLRQIVARPNMASAVAELVVLAAEWELLDGLRSVRGFPRLAQYVSSEHLATLVTGWPASRSTHLPCETLGLIAPPGPPLDEWRTSKLCKGLAGCPEHWPCCTTAGVRIATSHPPGSSDSTMTRWCCAISGSPHAAMNRARVLPTTRRPNNVGGPSPDRDRRPTCFSSPHWPITCSPGQLPSAVNPLPLRHYRPDLPESIGRAVDAALSPDPSARPGMSVLGAAFRPSPADPRRRSPHV